MEKEVLEEGKKTKEGRLKIKEIRKCNAVNTFYSSLAFTNEVIAAVCAIGGLYSFFQGARGKYFFDSSIMTFGACFLAITIGFISGITVPELREEAAEFSKRAELLKDEILESKEKGNVR